MITVMYRSVCSLTGSFFFFSSRRRHTRLQGDWSSDVCSSDLVDALADGLRIGVTLYDPDVIVLGGGLAEAREALFTPLAAALRARLTFQTMQIGRASCRERG